MRLELDQDDLKPEFDDVLTRDIGFEHLNAAAQAAVLAVGRGMFYHYKGTSCESHNLIYAPPDKV